MRHQPFPSINRVFGGDIKRSLSLMTSLFLTSVALAIVSQQFAADSMQRETCLQAGGLALLSTLLIALFDFFWMMGTMITMFLTMRVSAEVATPAGRP